MFSASLLPELLSDDSVSNLAHFGVTGGLALAAPWEPLPVAGAVIAALQRHVSETSRRVEGTGFRLRAGFGVFASQAPTRAADNAWDAIEEAAAARRIVAIGLLGVHGARAAVHNALRRQLAIASRTALPALLSTQSGARAQQTPVLLRAAEAAHLRLDRCVFVGADYTNIRPIVHSGAAVILPLGQGVQSDRATLALAVDYAAELRGRIMFGFSCLPSVPDCTAMARAAEQLAADSSIERHLAEALGETAIRLFDL